MDRIMGVQCEASLGTFESVCRLTVDHALRREGCRRCNAGHGNLLLGRVVGCGRFNLGFWFLHISGLQVTSCFRISLKFSPPPLLQLRPFEF